MTTVDCRMSSPTESHAATDDVDNPVELEEGEGSENVDLSDERRDTFNATTEDAETEDDEIIDDGASNHKRKRSSDVWQHFADIQVKEKGKMVSKVECICCKKKYKAVRGGPTTTLL